MLTLRAQYREEVFIIGGKDVSVQQIIVGMDVQSDTVISLAIKSRIYGLSVTGTVALENDQNSYVRVVLRDDHNYDYLVYECFPLLTETLTPQFQNTALETRFLDGIIPQDIIIELKNASINIDSFGYIPESDAAKRSVVNSAVLQKDQCRHIADMLNKNLIARNVTWRAGLTSMTEKSYEEKKAIFGGKVPELYGFDYYIGGIFVIPNRDKEKILTNKKHRITQFVNEWDWRNRHGKNWITSVKQQGACGSCGAFSAVGTLEAYVNLYYNQIINYDLSEEELISCAISNFDCYNNGINPGATGLYYVMFNGIVDEDCFSYTGNKQDCDQKCNNPSERIYLQHYGYIDDDENEDIVKMKLFKAPITFCLRSWGHAFVLVGYKTIEVGDCIQTGPNSSTIIFSSSGLIGKTAWLVKNSWGQYWGNNGYAYVVADQEDWRNLYYIWGKITSMCYNDTDIVCSDADGDGYYFWGVGDKLSSWPSWIPDSIDGNDNDPQKGKLCLESPHVIGEVETITPNGISTLTINSNTTYTTRQYKRTHIVIPSNKTLTIKNILNMFGRPTITVQSGGRLIVDGGVITNVYIDLAPGAKLELKNGGKIIMRTNTNFIAPVGALIDITHGAILRSNDF